MNKRIFAILGLTGALIGIGLPSKAQTGGIPRIPAPTSRMRGSFGTGRMMGGRAMSGQIVGNKNTKVYHLPGDKGNMPSAKNIVYFKTEAEARAAGYHAAGTRRTGMGRRPGMMGRMHGMSGMMHGTPPPRTGSFNH